MKTHETESPSPSAPAPQEPKTTDVCGNEYIGARCIRMRGHDGRHEVVYWQGTIPLRWD
ncbi:MAG: hypothetical protein H0T65_04030 [Deltaproteobacteria bacterium]|nr:hypothetical protein [Deltaproteobacteria bacterium]